MRGPSDHGDPVGSSVPRGGRQAPRASVSRAAQAARVLQAPPSAGRDAGVADGHVRQPEPWVLRRSVVDRLDPGGVRRSRETVKRSALADAADYGWCPSHSRYFWGFRLHAIFAPDGTPRALELTSPKIDEREVGLVLLDRCHRHGGETLLGDKGYAGREFAAQVKQRDATSYARAAKTKPGNGRTSRRSASGSSRSSGPAKTSSPSNATAPAPSPASGNGSSPGSAASPPRSPSTTNSDAQAVHSSTTAPNRAESTI